MPEDVVDKLDDSHLAEWLSSEAASVGVVLAFTMVGGLSRATELYFACEYFLWTTVTFPLAAVLCKPTIKLAHSLPNPWKREPN